MNISSLCYFLLQLLLQSLSWKNSFSFFTRSSQGQSVAMPRVETLKSSPRYTHGLPSMCAPLLLCTLDFTSCCSV